MVYLSRIYTKAGDGGETGLGDGNRVPKDHARVAAYRAVDELRVAGRVAGGGVVPSGPDRLPPGRAGRRDADARRAGQPAGVGLFESVVGPVVRPGPRRQPGREG